MTLGGWTQASRQRPAGGVIAAEYTGHRYPAPASFLVFGWLWDKRIMALLLCY